MIIKYLFCFKDIRNRKMFSSSLIKKIRLYMIIILIFLIALIYFASLKLNELSIETFKLNKSNPRYIFIDLGANKGDSVYNFIGVDKRANGGDLYYKNTLNITDDIEWTIYAFEPNKFFNKQLDEMKKKSEDLGHSLFLFKETAASTFDGKCDFYIDTYHSNYDFIGSSLNKNHKDVILSKSTATIIKCVDFGKFVKENLRMDDLVIVKMDIEGTEYAILIDLIKKEALKLVDHIAVEFHEFVSPFKKPEDVLRKMIESTGVKFLSWI
jgi:FkbM family methyltransferase